MNTVIFNDSSVQELFALPYESVIPQRGKDIPVLCIPCKPGMTLDDVKKIFGDPLKSSSMIFKEDSTEVRRSKDFIEIRQIAMEFTNPEDENETSKEYFIVKLSQAVSYDTEILSLKKTIDQINTSVESTKKAVDEAVKSVENVGAELNGTNGEIENIKKEMAGINPDELDLPNLKQYRINQSKLNLQEHLETHPITSFAHGGGDVGKKYSITSEKQSYLVSMILTTQLQNGVRSEAMKKWFDANRSTMDASLTFEEFVLGVNDGSITPDGVTFPRYQPSWNAHGEACTYDWTLEELVILSTEIEAVVRPLVSRQQSMEVSIKAASTKTAVNSVDLTFN